MIYSKGEKIENGYEVMADVSDEEFEQLHASSKDKNKYNVRPTY